MIVKPGHRRGKLAAAPVVLAAAAGILATLAAAGCGETTLVSSLRADAGRDHEAGKGWIDRGPFQRELLLTGELQAVRSIAIKAPQTAIFQMRIQFMAEEGALVRPGEPLLSFENSALAARVHELETSILDAETQIVSKSAELASALKDLEIELAEKQYEHDRTKLEASVDPEVLSRKVYGERQLAYESAQRELEETKDRVKLTRERGQAELDVLVINRDKLRKDLLSTQKDLELLTIKAPAEGLVVYEMRDQTTLRYQEGDSCWPGQGVMRLPDLTEMQVLFNANEVDAPLLRAGTPVQIRLDAFPGRALSGEIRHIPSMAVKRTEESKIAVFKVIASLSETWVGEMKPGMSVQGRIVLESLEDAPLLARDVVEFDGSTYRLRISGGGQEEDEAGREIRPLGRNASHYLISEEEYAELSGQGDRGAPNGSAVGE
ncbi:MAG TPA: efflux RND transporter periplasmic adaptor subunit, partial [Candidatus Polarisedimenticolia bacterium]|nr:efflux RND transporter periplasmic adaptor subunit [Candidatus Polarisedimenticolia bacterium]